jgi:predicted metal-dependent phosphoesterase TrpH
MTAYCDLHSHTLCSDGMLSPTALVDLAASRGLAALAVTDHDTVDGLAEACARGVERGVEVVPGIELSIEEGSLDVHLLGFFVTRPAVLGEALAVIRRDRIERARRIVERLRELGYELDYAAVEARARGGVVGRPHVAEEVVARGFATTLNEVFDRWLAADRPAYIAKRSIGLAEGAALLRRAGAVPVIAHPGPSDLDALLPWARDHGVAGLELWHPKHDEAQRRRYADIAQRHGLVTTGGTDFHREFPGGVLPGDLQIPMSVLDALRPHAT